MTVLLRRISPRIRIPEYRSLSPIIIYTLRNYYYTYRYYNYGHMNKKGELNPGINNWVENGSKGRRRTFEFDYIFTMRKELNNIQVTKTNKVHFPRLSIIHLRIL